MKYIVICTVALTVCFAAGFIVSYALKKISGKRFKKYETVVLTVTFGVIFMAITTLVYMSFSSHAGVKALNALRGNENVSVQEIDGGYFFDGPGRDFAVIFYPGAKVECEAYAPLMLKFAESGFDCFLADMPFNFAIFGGNTADKFLNGYNYEKLIMSGHSMGGMVASEYAEKHKDRISGIILLASYSATKIDSSIKLCSVYGSEDGCLDIEAYNANRDNMPADTFEYVIEGGNHAQFGDYGNQKDDGKALISDDEQQMITDDTIRSFFSDNF